MPLVACTQPLFQPFACKHVIQHSGRGGSACAEHRLRQQTLWCPTDKHRNWLNFNFSFLLCAMAAQPVLPKGSQRPPEPATPPRPKAPVQRPPEPAEPPKAKALAGGKSQGQAKASGARKRGSNRGESQNNREFLRWQADHNELQQLRFQHEQALTNLQNTEGELWSLEIQTQALLARAEAQLASASATLEAKNHSFASLFEAHRETTTRAKSLQHQLTITTEALARTNAEKLKIMEDIIQKNDRH